MRRKTLDVLLAFKRASGCSVIVTGGTEIGHSTRGTTTHGNGYKVDTSRASCETNYIKRNFKSAGTRSDGAALFTDANGNTYADEDFKNHWDITVQ